MAKNLYKVRKAFSPSIFDFQKFVPYIEKYQKSNHKEKWNADWTHIINSDQYFLLLEYNFLCLKTKDLKFSKILYENKLYAVNTDVIEQESYVIDDDC